MHILPLEIIAKEYVGLLLMEHKNSNRKSKVYEFERVTLSVEDDHMGTATMSLSRKYSSAAVDSIESGLFVMRKLGYSGPFVAGELLKVPFRRSDAARPRSGYDLPPVHGVNSIPAILGCGVIQTLPPRFHRGPGTTATRCQTQSRLS